MAGNLSGDEFAKFLSGEANFKLWLKVIFAMPKIPFMKAAFEILKGTKSKMVDGAILDHLSVIALLLIVLIGLPHGALDGSIAMHLGAGRSFTSVLQFLFLYLLCKCGRCVDLV